MHPEQTNEIITGVTNTTRPQSRFALGFLALTVATSSIVFIEPAPYDLLVIVLMCGMLVTGLRFPREMQLATAVLGLFALGNIIAAAGAIEPLSTIRSLSVRLYMVIAWCLFVSLIVANPIRVMKTIWAGYLVAALIAVTWGALEYFGFISIDGWAPGLRAKGPFKNPNVFAPFLVPVAIHTLRHIATDPRWAGRLLYSAAFAWLAFGLLLSFSRGGWLNFVIAATLFSILAFTSFATYRARLSWLLVNALMVLIVVGAIGLSATTASVGDRLVQRAVLTQSYDVARGGRFYTQSQAIQKIVKTPLGIGPGRSDEEFGLEPHNLFLHIFVEGGWLAGASFLFFIGLTLVRATRLFRWRSPLRMEFYVVFASLIGVLSQSLFIDSTHWRHSWLLLAMLWGLIIVHQRDQTAV